MLEWMNMKYGKHVAVTAMHGKVHDYLGMSFDISNKGKVVIYMAKYMSQLVDEFPHKITKKAKVAGCRGSVWHRTWWKSQQRTSKDI
jgi:hypothetical protein